MTVYKRLGTPEQQQHARLLQARIAAANQAVIDAELAALARKAEASERKARLAGLAAEGTFMERAQAARDWAMERWPENEIRGAMRLRAAVREVEEYSAAHPRAFSDHMRPSNIAVGQSHHPAPVNASGRQTTPKQTHSRRNTHTAETETR